MKNNVAARTNEFVRGTPSNKITLAQATPFLVPYMASRPEKLGPAYLGQYQLFVYCLSSWIAASAPGCIPTLSMETRNLKLQIGIMAVQFKLLYKFPKSNDFLQGGDDRCRLLQAQ